MSFSRENYYQILGVSRNSSAGTIKRAYRRLAIKWHPDKNKNRAQEAEANFKRIAEAYSILCDPVKRKSYTLREEETQVGESNSLEAIFIPELEFFTIEHAEQVFDNFFRDKDNKSHSSYFGSSNQTNINDKRKGDQIFEEDDDDDDDLEDLTFDFKTSEEGWSENSVHYEAGEKISCKEEFCNGKSVEPTLKNGRKVIVTQFDDDKEKAGAKKI